MHTFENSVGKELFVLGYTPQALNDFCVPMSISLTKVEVVSKLGTAPAVSFGDASLLHGTLAKATSIPSDIDANMDIFLIIPKATDDLESCFIQCADLAFLQSLVSALVSDENPTELADDVVDELLGVDMQDIESLYVLYGYEVELQLQIDSDSLDEEIIEESKKVYTTVKEGEELYETLTKNTGT